MKTMQYTRSIAVTTIMMIFMSVMLPFFAVSSAQAKVPSGGFVSVDDDPRDGKILICTSRGYRWVTWNELQDERHAPERNLHNDCPTCVTGSGGLDDIHFEISLRNASLNENKLSVRTSRDAGVIPQKRRTSARLTRAPPISI